MIDVIEPITNDGVGGEPETHVPGGTNVEVKCIEKEMVNQVHMTMGRNKPHQKRSAESSFWKRSRDPPKDLYPKTAEK